MSVIDIPAEAGIVQAQMSYSVWTGVKPVNETGGPDGLMRRPPGTYQQPPVSIVDGRRAPAASGLDLSGFELTEHPTRMRDFFNREELASVYYAEMEQLIAQRSGARRVRVFDHTLRSSDDDDRAVRKIREPVKSVHNDYTEWSGPQRVRDILPDEAETLLQRRFATIQGRRAIHPPIDSKPPPGLDSAPDPPHDLPVPDR